AFKVRTFAIDSPTRSSLGARARITAAGSSGSSAALSRPQIALALAVDSCCDTTIEASPTNPSARRRSGGRPAPATALAKRGSASIRRAIAVSRSASVWMKKDMTAAKHLQMRCRRNPFSGPALVAAHEYLNLSLRAESQRLSASRPCAFRADQLRHGARRRRGTAAGHRGYGYHAVPLRVRHLALP